MEALKDAGEEMRIYFEHREAPLHFEVGEEHHAAVLMPLRMASLTSKDWLRDESVILRMWADPKPSDRIPLFESQCSPLPSDTH